MAAVDRAAIGSGLDGFRLMEAAGSAISACVLRFYPEAARALVLCGPGNNGGDGYVAARQLRASGMTVTVCSLIDPQGLSGDAAQARDYWGGPVEGIDAVRATQEQIVIDALFGGGLDRPIEGPAKSVIEAINREGLPVISADLPSGISGRSGEICGAALKAAHTVTFVAAKPGHFLFPGAAHCGTLHVADIGIPLRFVRQQQHELWLNAPAVWRTQLPEIHMSGHKYTSGHLGVFSGTFAQTGAARLAALAGLRAGAGLVTVFAPASAVASNAAHLTAIMLRKINDGDDLDELLKDDRLNSLVLGPAFGVGERARDFVRRIADSGRSLVLDADGLTTFSEDPGSLRSWFAGDRPRLLLTPHQGEFARLFPDLAADAKLSKVDRARMAAESVNAVVLYKGADTVIASPDGRAVINANAPPWLATAGSGDCLAGIAGGLVAQGMPVFEAAAAAAYMHGVAGQVAGEGLTAEDLPDNLPPLSSFRKENAGG
jgi:NAD(P)H-hydrate epimerase